MILYYYLYHMMYAKPLNANKPCKHVTCKSLPIQMLLSHDTNALAICCVLPSCPIKKSISCVQETLLDGISFKRATACCKKARPSHTIEFVPNFERKLQEPFVYCLALIFHCGTSLNMIMLVGLTRTSNS
jgi:hypothetical protein